MSSEFFDHAGSLCVAGGNDCHDRSICYTQIVYAMESQLAYLLGLISLLLLDIHRAKEWPDITRERNLGRPFMFALLFYHAAWESGNSGSFDYLVGTSTGAPLSFTKNTTNFAGLVSLAFRPTT